MNIIVYFTEGLLYLCFAILIGGQAVKLLPEGRFPPVKIPAFLLPTSVIGIAVLSLFPVLQTTKAFADYFQVGFWSLLPDVLTDLSIGKAWIWTVVLSLVAITVHAFRDVIKDKISTIIILVLAIGLEVLLAWGSHTSSINPSLGFAAHGMHVLSMSIWIGLLLYAGWFAEDNTNWASFLRWFTPLAAVCLAAMLVSGLLIMEVTVPEYINSWALNYGQLLLIKHLLIVPLAAIAFANGILTRWTIKKHGFDPKQWVRMESIIVLVIFWVTGTMGQQAPPHDVSETLKFTEPSSLFISLFRGSFDTQASLQIGFSLPGVLLAVSAVLFVVLIPLLFWQKRPAALAIASGLLAVIAAYLALMLSLTQ